MILDHASQPCGHRVERTRCGFDVTRTFFRREYERIAVAVPLYVRYGRTVYQKEVRLESKNVSGGGLAFETSRKIPMDADARILVAGFADLPSDARIEGRVVYRIGNPETGRYAVGIEFTRFVGVDRAALIEHIERWSRETQLTPT